MLIPLFTFALLFLSCSGEKTGALHSRSSSKLHNPSRFSAAAAAHNQRTIPTFVPMLDGTSTGKSKGSFAPLLPFRRKNQNVQNHQQIHPVLESAHATKWLSIRGGKQQTSSARNMIGLDQASAFVSAIGNGSPFLNYNLIILFMNILGFVISVVTKGSHLHLDLIGTGAFAIASLPALLSGSVPLRVTLSSAMVVTWAVKLAGFLFFRACQIKTDVRLDGMLSTISGTFGFWFISAVWGWVCSLPHALGIASSANGNNLALITGVAMSATGLVVESLADYQKWTFKQTNPGEFCGVGLWKISQHPNFFGNMLLWSGIFIMNASALIQRSEGRAAISGVSDILSAVWEYRLVGLALLGPLFMLGLFSGQAGGTIGSAVELSAKRYGGDPKYVEYIKSVPLIFPKFMSKS